MTTQCKFPNGFDSYACVGDTITTTIDGFDIVARIEFDEDSHIDDDDCHNVDQSVTGCNDEEQDRICANRMAWLCDEWFYCGIVLAVSKRGVVLDDHAASLWSIECNYPSDNADNPPNNHLTDCANEMIEEAIAAGKKKLAELLV